MYPRLSDLFYDLFGVQSPVPLYSFGLMVAVGILTAAALLKREMDRQHAAGLLPSVQVKAETKRGKQRFEKGPPSEIVGTMALLAGAAGIAGSKLFHIFDYWDRFVANPAAMIFSASGLTFYGGLICGAIAVAWYVRKKGLPVARVADAIAPGLILGYGIGRIGCYLSGDGDWGLCSSLADKPGWIPGWLWSETFPRSVTLGGNPTLETLFAFNNQRGDTCMPGVHDGVYPTMLYEFVACSLLAAGLWAIRKHPFKAGWLFSAYLVVNGLERFVVEFVRLNPDNVGGLSQAQLIAIGLMLAGAVGLALTTRRVAPPQTVQA